ncbi:MAG: hypothetical protein Kow001_09640 [Acidobacteriota bacterium]
MIKSLRESMAKLSELMERAHRGEDIRITVPGRVKARLTRATPVKDELDLGAWVEELRKLQAEYSTGKATLTIDEILRRTADSRQTPTTGIRQPC